jgi:SAM-dependent methyltransferase
MGRLDIATRWRTTLGHWLDRSQLRGALPAAGRVLDIGCGGACRVPEGPTPYGIEISKALASRAAPAFEARGGAVVNASAIDGLEQFAGQFFSGIMMRSFLEHESQPRSLLESAFRSLAPGGVVFVRVPNFGGINRRVVGREWCGFRFPDHVNYFTGASLRRLAERTGFGYRRLNWLSPFDDNLIAVLNKSAA